MRLRQIVLTHLRRVKGRLALAALCMLGYAAAQLAGPWPLKIVFDHILLDKPLSPAVRFLAGTLEGGKLFAVLVLSVAILLIALLRGLFSYAQLYLTSRIGHELVHTLRRELFAHLQRLSLSFHSRARSGELLTKITGDTATLKDVFTESALTFTVHLLSVGGMFAVMFVLDWRLSLVVLATIPFVLYTLSVLYRNIKVSAKRQRKQEGRIASRISEILTAVPLVQAFGRERYEQERFETEQAQNLGEGIRTARMEAAATRTVEICKACGTCAVVLLGTAQVLKGAMMPGDLLIFTAYLSSMYKPLRDLAKLSAKFSKAVVSAERIAEILDVEPEIQDSPDAVDAAHLRGEIVFDGVSFDYGDGKGVLDGVSFAISPGQRVALVGVSGAGKSTVVSLILRLWDPQRGAILVDDRNLKDYRRESLRRQIGLVLQDSLLFGATIKENIAYGKPDATMEEIVAAATAANADDFIGDLEHGYETVVGERGATLSGGQRQRIAIARAIIRNAAILILDEPMTGLDVESEAKVREALGRLMAGKTSLLITHDLRAVAEADLVLVLEGGRIVAQGRHRDLVAQSRRYRRLYQLKTGPHEAREVSLEEV